MAPRSASTPARSSPNAASRTTRSKRWRPRRMSNPWSSAASTAPSPADAERSGARQRAFRRHDGRARRGAGRGGGRRTGAGDRAGGRAGSSAPATTSASCAPPRTRPPTRGSSSAARRLMMAIGESRAPVIARVQARRWRPAASWGQLRPRYAAGHRPVRRLRINLGLFCSTPGVASAAPSGARRRPTCAHRPVHRRGPRRARPDQSGGPRRSRPDRGRNRRDHRASRPRPSRSASPVLRRQLEAPLADAYALASRAMAENLAFPSARAGIGRLHQALD